MKKENQAYQKSTPDQKFRYYRLSLKEIRDLDGLLLHLAGRRLRCFQRRNSSSGRLSCTGCGSPVLRRSHAKIQSCGTCMRRSGSGAAGSCVASLKTLCMLRRMRRCMLRNCRTRILQSGLQLGSAAVLHCEVL